MAGVYVHIPFCRQKCYYCDFFSCISLAKAEPMLNAILHELELQRSFMGCTGLDTIYIGGGTPTVYSPAQLQQIIDKIASLWDVSSVREITVEMNPDDLSQGYLSALSATQVNRLSIGIQSFDDAQLRFMNRRHTAAAAVQAVVQAQKAGYDNITIDLIYGIPGMTIDMWRSNIEQALALGVQHISAYHLTIEDRTVFGKRASGGELAPIAEQQSEEQYRLLHQMMCEAGMEHYEISNFALPGYRALHNSSYWHGQPYLGVGPSAHSFDGEHRRWSVASIEGYLAGYVSGEAYSQETLTQRDCYNEYVMTSLRCAQGVDCCEIERRFGARTLKYFEQMARKFIDSGILLHDGSAYRLPPEEFLIADSVICELFELDEIE